MILTSLQDGYSYLGEWLLDHGEVQASRASGASPRTREVVGFGLTLLDPTRSLPVGTGRALNPAIGAVEALQLVGGWSDPPLQCRVAPNMRAFMDAGVFHGAYGLRLAQQLPDLLYRLRRDETSRQGVVTLWDPARDSQDGPRDLPCTVSLQFLVRQDQLHCVANMRSNDFWWGLAYDAFQFTQLQATLAQLLGIGVGKYHHFAGSFHLYERDWDKVAGLHPPTADHPWCPGFATMVDREWRDVQLRTRWIVGDGGPCITTDHKWYVDVMAPFLPAA